MKLKSIKKMALVTEAATLELRVTQKDGLSVSAVELASTGVDDASFRDAELTPGPASKILDPANSYGLLWIVAFTRAGSATLIATVTTASGSSEVARKQVEGKAGQVVNRMVFIP